MSENNVLTSDDLVMLEKTFYKTTMSLEQTKKYSATKVSINDICESLNQETESYNPSQIINNIEAYLEVKEKMDRILYSEISIFIFSLGDAERGVFATNVEGLLIYSLDDENCVSDDCRKIIIKIYDHVQLVLNQIENTNNIFADSIENAKVNLQKEVKNIEKEYISILGIFAAIVLAFVGGITFSSSVLQNIDSVSIYRLLIVVDLLAFILTNVIYTLIKFILIINDKDLKIFRIGYINGIYVVFTVIIFLGWLFSLQTLPSFIRIFLPWC